MSRLIPRRLWVPLGYVLAGTALLSGAEDAYGGGGFPALCLPMMLAACPRGL
jgi:hypothetical protein